MWRYLLEGPLGDDWVMRVKPAWMGSVSLWNRRQRAPSALPPREGTTRIPPSATQKRALLGPTVLASWSQTSRLETSRLRNCEKCIPVVYKLPSLWHFVPAAQTKPRTLEFWTVHLLTYNKNNLLPNLEPGGGRLSPDLWLKKNSPKMAWNMIDSQHILNVIILLI